MNKKYNKPQIKEIETSASCFFMQGSSSSEEPQKHDSYSSNPAYAKRQSIWGYLEDNK